MYIGTDLIAKNGLAEIIDKLDFTFSIYPNSIPFQNKYGVSINATTFTILDIAPSIIKEAISKLNTEVEVSQVEVKGRTIDAVLNYKGNKLALTTEANIR